MYSLLSPLQVRTSRFWQLELEHEHEPPVEHCTQSVQASLWLPDDVIVIKLQIAADVMLSEPAQPQTVEMITAGGWLKDACVCTVRPPHSVNACVGGFAISVSVRPLRVSCSLLPNDNHPTATPSDTDAARLCK